MRGFLLSPFLALVSCSLVTIRDRTYYRAVFRTSSTPTKFVRSYGKVRTDGTKVIFSGICIPAKGSEYTGEPEP